MKTVVVVVLCGLLVGRATSRSSFWSDTSGWCRELDGVYFVGNGVEDGGGVGEEVLWRVVFDDSASVQDDDEVVVDDGVYSVSYGENGAVRKVLPDDVLDDVVGRDVHGGCGFVEEDDLAFSEEGSGETNQLFLSQRDVIGDACHLRVDSVWQGLYKRERVGVGQCLVDFVSRVFVEGVQIVPEASGEDVGFLRYDGDDGPELFEADLRDIDVVDEYVSELDAVESKDGREKGGFSRPGSPTNSNLFSSLDGEAEVVEDGGLVGVVPEYDVVEDNASTAWPVWGCGGGGGWWWWWWC